MSEEQWTREREAFLSLPRLAGRLTAELILRSPQGLDPCQDYAIDLRGEPSTERHKSSINPPSPAFAPPNPTDPRVAITLTSNPAPFHPTLTANKIAAIENMGATQNQFDAIDLSDNEIVKLEGFPPLSRLHTLYLSNNRIARVGVDLSQQIPMLKALYLTNNRLKNLADLDPLKSCKRLTHLSLLGNPVSKNPDYRLYAVYSLPALKVLDFRKVKLAEREAAEKKFGGKDGLKAREAAKTFEVGDVGTGGGANADGADESAAPGGQGPTPQQLLALQAAIANAETLEEVARLENALSNGVMPSDFQI